MSTLSTLGREVVFGSSVYLAHLLNKTEKIAFSRT